MDGSTGASFIALILVLALIGVMVYLYISFSDHKTSMEKEVEEVDGKATRNKQLVANETINRLGNIKHVVNQVNDINDTIWYTHQDTASSNQARMDELKASNETLIQGVDTFFKFSTDSITDQRLYDSSSMLTADDRPHLDVIKQVNLVSGMTAKDLSPPTTNSSGNVDGVMAKFCAKGGSPCISFPNDEGDTYLTALSEGQNIVMDAPVKIKQGLLFEGTDSAQVSSPDGIFFNSHVGIGSTAKIESVLGLSSDDTTIQNLLHAGHIMIKPDGRLVLKNETGDAQATLQVNNNGKLIITPPSSGLEVVGNMNVTGSSTVGGNAVTTDSTTDS